MEELVRKEQELQAASPKARPAIDISYVELPTKLTSRIDLSGILGSIAFLAMLAAPGAVEGGMYITAAVLVAIFAACACLSIKENGKRDRPHHSQKLGPTKDIIMRCIYYNRCGKEKSMEAMKINKLEIENVKRVKAVKLEPTANGLTIIGGNNRQGKTSVLDSIAWALGGDRYRPSMPQREGSVIPPMLHIVMSNGLVVERKGKNSDLKVTDPSGRKGGQQLLNEFVEQLAIDLPKFLESSSQDKAKTLLRIIGVGDRLEELERQEKELYNQRLAIGQIADQKKKYAKEQPYYPDAPKDIVSPTELIRQQQDILARNGENQRKRDRADRYRQSVALLSREVESLQEQMSKKRQELEEAQMNLNTAMMEAQDLDDQSTAELEQSISNIEEVNRKVRANLDKDKAEEDALAYRNQYDSLTSRISQVRQDKAALLGSAELPLPGLSVADGELVYNGQRWDNMSGSDHLKVATAIVRKLNPKCGFVLLDKLEQMDLQTLQEFGKWLEQEGLQAIATRVSTGEECSIIISDGYVEGQGHPAMEDKKTEWKAGEF